MYKSSAFGQQDVAIDTHSTSCHSFFFRRCLLLLLRHSTELFNVPLSTFCETFQVVPTGSLYKTFGECVAMTFVFKNPRFKMMSHVMDIF